MMNPQISAIETCQTVKRCDKVGALRGIDLTVNTGKMFALPGPNSAGKGA